MHAEDLLQVVGQPVYPCPKPGQNMKIEKDVYKK
jgi:hypothetical protein